MECCCCQAKAKYEVNTQLVCGRHLGYVIRKSCETPPREIKVRVLEKKIGVKVWNQAVLKRKEKNQNDTRQAKELNMKTKYKYIEFKQTAIESVWTCRNHKSGTELGTTHYNKKWKEHEFWPEDGMAFTIECLRDIADFLGQLNR